MKKKLKVFKFGGASVKDAAGVRNVTNILKTFKDDPIIIVVSAMGKTTDALEKIVAAHANKTGEASTLVENLKQAHYAIIAELFGNAHPVYDDVNDTFVSIDWVLDDEPHPNYDFMYDQIVSVGELVSSKIVAAYLSHAGLPTTWLDARDVILTDDIY
ncbi:MAG: aspartate kinase, partial [Saprospiraceae bacterium]|nr:aspartate kinase [Saprospiraceae bacterium]